MEITQLVPSKQRNPENRTIRTDSIFTFKLSLIAVHFFTCLDNNINVVSCEPHFLVHH